MTADVHADDFGSTLDASTGLNARWLDSIAMVRWVATDARERGADALVIAGDFTERRKPEPWRIDAIGDAFDAFGGPTIAIRGNHDHERAGRSIVDVLARRPGWHGFTRPGVAVVGDVAIAALPYLDSHWLRTQPGFEHVPDTEVLQVLAEQFVTIAAGLYVEASVLAPRRVLTVHQGLSGGLMSDTQAAFLGDRSLVVDSRALGAIGFDAIVAGHFHLHQVLSTDPLIAYAGAPTRTDFGEEHQVKGYLLVDVTSAAVGMEFVETPARRYVTLSGEDIGQPGSVDVDVADAIVRVVDLAPDIDTGMLRRYLEACGAFAITSIKTKPVEAPEVTGGLSESLSAEQATDAYFADDPDREALVELGRSILAEVGS